MPTFDECASISETDSVSVDEPQGQIFGGVVAAPAFRDIAKFALQYLDVPPDDTTSLSGSTS